MAKVAGGTGLLIILLIIGGIFGTLLGHFLGDYLSFLGFGQTIGMDPATVDLLVISLTAGFTLNINIATIIGFFLAILIYKYLG